MQEISKWLSNPNRDAMAGVALLNRFSNNKTLCRLISLKISQPYYLAKLEYELRKLVKVKAAGPVKRLPTLIKTERTAKRQPPLPAMSDKQVDASAEKPTSRLTAIEFAKAPPAIQGLELKWKKLYKKRAYLRANLESMATDEMRLEAALLIVKMGETIDGIFTDLDYYRKHGVLPQSVALPDVPTDLKDVEDELRRCRSRISKLKKLPRTPKQEEKYAADLLLKVRLESQRAKFPQST